MLRVKAGETITFFGTPGSVYNSPTDGKLLTIDDCRLPPAK